MMAPITAPHGADTADEDNMGGPVQHRQSPGRTGRRNQLIVEECRDNIELTKLAYVSRT